MQILELQNVSIVLLVLIQGVVQDIVFHVLLEKDQMKKAHLVKIVLLELFQAQVPQYVIFVQEGLSLIGDHHIVIIARMEINLKLIKLDVKLVQQEPI